MPAQVNIFLLLFGALQGILLSFVLIRKRTYRTGYIFLSIYVLVMLLQILMKVVSKIWAMNHLFFWYDLSYRLPLLYGPLVYLLCIFLLIPGRKFKLIDTLHFLPFAFSVLTIYFYPAGGTPLHFMTTSYGLLGLQLSSIAIYHCLALSCWYRNRKAAKENFSNLSRVQVTWLRLFIVLSFFISGLIAFGLYFIYIHFPQFNNLRILFAGLTLFIYWISYTALQQPEIFTVVKGSGHVSEIPPPKLHFHLPQQRYNNSGLKDHDAARILSDLRRLMNDEKLYLEPNLTMEGLAKQLSCSKHHLSQVLNNQLRQTFYDYVNSCRIDAAKQLLSDPAKDNYKIAAIAYDSGFNSLSTFNDVFKKITGTTPSRFRTQQVEFLRKQRV